MNKTLKTTAGILAACLLIILLGAALAVSFSREGLLPAFLPIRAYAVEQEVLPDLLPKGSLVIIDPDAALEAGHVVLSSEHTFTVADGEGGLVLLEDPAVVYDSGHAIGRVTYRIALLGSVCLFLQQYRVALWVLCILLTAAVGAWMATAPKRRRRREVQELIELFDYYGRKYDAEEEGIDY